ELEEAAVVDGCNQWSTFVRVMLPLARPAVATLVVLSFLTSWNDYLWPVFVLFSGEMQTLPSGLRLLQAENGTRYDVMMAGAAIASVPVLGRCLFAQRWIIEGVSTSGVKGCPPPHPKGPPWHRRPLRPAATSPLASAPHTSTRRSTGTSWIPLSSATSN